MSQFLYRQRKEISIPGSEESGAYGGGGLLCCFLRSGTVLPLLNDISDLVLGYFHNFVIKPPGKVVIGSLDCSAFSGLVLGFGLFQLSP
jgi:hypothetical protein